ncbi:hypothetical protein EON80_23370 [bacterium]|nr:MAG: hypothetical protein EON80_23370 [bacterium]
MLSRLLSLVLVAALLTGCKPPADSPPSSPGVKPVSTAPSATVKDDLGREIKLRGEVKRVVVIGPGAIETTYALGAQSKLIGRDSYADFPPAAKKIAIAGDYTGHSVEKCVALHPDLIIVQGETWDKGRVENWQQQIGAPVAALTATNLKAVQDDFLKMGTWLGQSAVATRLAKTLDSAPVKAPVAAFVEVGRSPLFTAGKGTLVADVLRAGGFSNVADDITGYQPFGLESLLSRQPEAYVSPSSNPSTKVLAELRASPTLSKLKCIRAGRVITIKGDYLLRPGPRLRLGIDQLKKEAQRITLAR